MEKLLLPLLAMLAVSGTALASSAANERAALRICAKATKNINLLADFTRTDCTPAKEAQRHSLIFVSLDPIFANPKSKKAYLIVLVGAVGAELNSSSAARIENINIMDKELGRQRTYFTIPARDAARLQEDIRTDRIDLEGFYRGILSAGKVRAVAK